MTKLTPDPAITIRSLHKEIAELKENQTRFKTVFENSRLGNKIISPDLKIVQINMSLVYLLGYTEKEELIGKAILDYAPAHCHKDWKLLQGKLWEKALPSFSLETCLIRKDGTIVWC